MTDLTHNPDRYPHNGGNADTDLLCRACEMGVPVKRAMPGPPEHRPNAHPHGDGSDGWCPICHHLHARRPVGSNRLTDAECWAECHHADAAWAKASVQVLMGYRPMTDELEAGLHRQLHETGIWYRFAALPHALEVEA